MADPRYLLIRRAFCLLMMLLAVALVLAGARTRTRWLPGLGTATAAIALLMAMRFFVLGPGFKQMLEDIEAGYVTTVIVKESCAIITLNQKDFEK